MSVEKLITDNIDIWTSALKTKSASGRGNGKKLELYGVKKLRELILELAVRGKLVPQDPNDEPASKLLERIAEEKAQLVKNKKIKPPKKLPEITEKDKPFELPYGWEFKRLGDLGLVGSSSRVQKKDWQTSGIPFYRAREIVKLSTNGFVDNELFISEDLFNELSENGTAPMPNDIMVTGVGTIGIPYIVTEKDHFYFKDASVLIFKNLADLYSQYLFTYMKSPLWNRDIYKDSMGTTVHTLTIVRANNVIVPVPSENEQQRIVTKVDELMVLCNQLEQQTESSIDAHKTLVEVLLTTLTNSTDADELAQNWARISEHFDILFTTEHSIDQLKQTVLQLAVMGKLVDFGNFEVKTVKQLLCFGPRNGFSPKEAPTPTDCKVLKLSATSYGYLDVEQSKFVDVEVEPESHLWLKEGDILVQRGNSATFVGSNVIVDKDYSGYIYPDLMMKLRTNDLIVPEYLSLVLSASSSRESMWSQMTGTSGTMPKISKKVVEGVSIPVPADKQVQMEIVKEVNRISLIIDSLRLKLKQSQMTRIYLANAFVAELL